ncbi:hypothetical protein CYMTET_16413 [Cymbomonas tetramitiformis]|uniref:Reverse transcriptase Ty1/copia-type domain-containing protein n=1 Tax=Cymbomonas tetramitiformis TaxID=36881 RepID=A0AAE0GCL3_9CHLO|nr:hypothetical protein CYMTET_16413 [Cymbomonas tetramitiformis]
MPYPDEFIGRLLVKVLMDFRKKPEETKFLLVLPEKPGAVWWTLTAKLEALETYSKGSVIFSARKDQCYRVEELTKSEPGRVFIRGTPWPVTEFYLDQFTVGRVDAELLAHLRLGHLCDKYVRVMDLQGVDVGVNSEELQTSELTRCSEVCAPCQVANATRPSQAMDRGRVKKVHRKLVVKRVRSARMGQLTLTDHGGPFVPSDKGYHSYTIHLDDYSDFGGFYAWRRKLEYTTALEEYRQVVVTTGRAVLGEDLRVEEVVYDQDLLVLHSDSDSTMIQGRARDYCAANNILQRTTSYLHENNARAETHNCRVQEMGRAMLLVAGLPASMWPLAFRHRVYLLNRVVKAHLVNEHELPYQVLLWRHCGQHARAMDVSETSVRFPVQHVALAVQVKKEEWLPVGVTAPKQWAQLIAAPDAKEWMESDHEEECALIDVKKAIVPKSKLPVGVQPLGMKAVYVPKLDAANVLAKQKSRWVVMGNKQEHGVNYEEVYAPCTQLTTLRIIIQKSLYGLKQAPRVWYYTSKKWVLEYDDRLTNIDPCLIYIHDVSASGLVVFLYIHVDDYVCFTSNVQWKTELFAAFNAKWPSVDKGPMVEMMGMQMTFSSTGLVRECRMSQVGLIRRMLEKYGMTDCTPSPTPMEPKLSLLPADPKQPTVSFPFANLAMERMWLARCSRPDVLTTVCYLARFMHCYDEVHWKHLLRVLRYLKGTIDDCLALQCSSPASLTAKLVVTAYSDSEHAADRVPRRSVTGSLVQLNGSTVLYSSRLQKTVAISTTDGELVALLETARDAEYVVNLLLEIHPVQLPVVLHGDNHASVFQVEHALNNTATRHIAIRERCVARLLVELKRIVLAKVPTAQNLADFFTKALSVERFLVLRAVGRSVEVKKRRYGQEVQRRWAVRTRDVGLRRHSDQAGARVLKYMDDFLARLKKTHVKATALICRAARAQRWVQARELAGFNGLCQSVYLAVPAARLYPRELYFVLGKKRSWGSKVKLTRHAWGVLKGWSLLPATSRWNGREIWRTLTRAKLHTDPSLFAWGGVLNLSKEARGFWPDELRELHITHLELEAVHKTVRSFLTELEGKLVRLYCNNQAVVVILAMLSHFTSQNPEQMRRMRRLWLLLDLHDIELQARGWRRWRGCQGDGGDGETALRLPLANAEQMTLFRACVYVVVAFVTFGRPQTGTHGNAAREPAAGQQHDLDCA